MLRKFKIEKVSWKPGQPVRTSTWKQSLKYTAFQQYWHNNFNDSYSLNYVDAEGYTVNLTAYPLPEREIRVLFCA